MSDNIALGPAARISHNLDLLRAAALDTAIDTPRADLMLGFFLDTDPAMQIDGRFSSPHGRVLELEVAARGVGHWAALHMDVGPQDITGMGFVGIACRSSAPDLTVIQPCLRSGTEGGFVDCFFDKHILSRASPASHLDVIPVGQRDTLPLTAPWRELIFFLPHHGFHWALQDLRVFIV